MNQKERERERERNERMDVLGNEQTSTDVRAEERKYDKSRRVEINRRSTEPNRRRAKVRVSSGRSFEKHIFNYYLYPSYFLSELN